MNKMEEIAKLLDVKLNEKFGLEDHGDALFKLTEDGFLVYNHDDGEWDAQCEYLLVDILTGKEKIVRHTPFMLNSKESGLIHKMAGNNWVAPSIIFDLGGEVHEGYMFYNETGENFVVCFNTNQKCCEDFQFKHNLKFKYGEELIVS